MWRCDDCGWTNPDKHTPELCKTRQTIDAYRDEIMRLRRELERRESGQKVRFYLQRVTDYALHGYEPIRHTHVDAHAPELVRLMSSKFARHPWQLVSAHVVEEADDACDSSGREDESDDDDDA